MKNLPAILLIIILIALSSCKYFKGWNLFGRKKAELAELMEQQRMIRVADSLKLVKDKLQAIEQAKLDSIRLAEEERLVLASKYNIIVGAFITPEYAKAWAEEYRNRGYDAKIIKMEGGRFELVSAEAYESVGKAYSRLEKFRDTVQVDAWIYNKK
jgi:hypothetical protein